MKNKANTLPMNKDISDHECLSLGELISYSNDNLNSKEKIRLEPHIKSCELCSDAIEGYRLNSSEPQFRKTVSELQSTVHQKLNQKSSAGRNWRWYYAIAAALVLALMSTFYMLQHKQLHERAFAHYFQIYPNTLPLVRGESGKNSFTNAMIEYEMENFPACSTILDRLLIKEHDNDAAHFYAGICNLTMGEPEPAIHHFKTIIRNNNPHYTNQARWYYGLSILKTGNVDEARTVFQAIAADSKFKPQGEDILNFLANN